MQTLHTAKLLSDDELFAIEDLCADFLELQSSAGAITAELTYYFEVARKVCKLVGVSEGMAADASFARQVRRKFV